MPKKKPSKKTDDLDDFLDAPKRTQCKTCLRAESNPQFGAALKRYEERREKGTTTISIMRFYSWLHEKGLTGDVGNSAFGRHYRECRTLRPLA